LLVAGFKDAALERAVLDALDRQTSAARFAGDDGAIAVAWLESLRAAGMHPNALESSLYLSVPERSELAVDGQDLPCQPAAFSRATDGERIEGPAVTTEADSDAPLAGHVAVITGPLEPETVYRVERRGAIAQVYVAADEVVRRVPATTIRGAPTHENAARRPRTPIVCVSRSVAERLTRGSSGRSVARVATWLREGWSRCVVPVVDVHGTQDVEEFVLVHGGDAAALLSMARALHACRSQLKRSVRVVWWPARAESSFGASAWYADAHATEIDEWCIAHVVVDAPEEATFAEPTWMSEGAELCLDAIADVGAEAVKGRRPARAANYSFNQIGVSGVFGGRRFARDLHAYLAVVTRLVTAPLHPLDYTATVLEIGAAVQRYQAAAGNEVTLGGVSQDLGALRHAISAWRSDAETEIGRHASDRARRHRLNATWRRLARVLVPLGYARGERFDHDPAVRYSAVPRLEAALHVASVPEEMKPFVRNALAREQNKIRGAIREARRLVT
jgi:hypothetical protein